MANNAKKRLHFNRTKAISGYRKAIRQATGQLLEELYADIYDTLKTSEGKADIEKMSEQEENIIRRAVRGYAHAIIDSYGTGSKMDTHRNSGLDEYKQSSLYNPSRKGKAIVGRPKGEYTNIFGETVTSTGKAEGRNIEKFVKPIAPSYAFQRAEVWLIKGDRMGWVLTQHINQWISGMSQYFEYR